MALIVIGDDLYSHVPFVEQLAAVAPALRVSGQAQLPIRPCMAAVAAAEGTEQSQTGQWTEGSGARQRTYTYRLVRQVPLSLESAVRVTYVEVWEQSAKGELLYHNSWITDLDVDAANVAVVVQIGRTRWKIENEQFNVHKNHGYDLTHNYGHGQQTLIDGVLPLESPGLCDPCGPGVGRSALSALPRPGVAPRVMECVAHPGERVSRRRAGPPC